jgi:hypothetical protein
MQDDNNAPVIELTNEQLDAVSGGTFDIEKIDFVFEGLTPTLNGSSTTKSAFLNGK